MSFIEKMKKMCWQVPLSNLKVANIKKYTYLVCRNNVKPNGIVPRWGEFFPSSCLTDRAKHWDVS